MSTESQSANFAFVLLSQACLPDAEQVVRLFRTFAAPDMSLRPGTCEEEQAVRDGILSLTLSTGETSLVALMPAPVPNREADDGAQFSLSSFAGQWELPSHCAHLMVTLHATTESSPLVRLSRFTSVLAAVTAASPSVGVYWGNAGATHDPEFFTSVAADLGVAPRMMLWSGVSVARENDGRVSLLSLGMQQLDLPDLLLVAGESSANVALETMFDLLAYAAERGEALPEGDTVGRSAEERLAVRYVQSPADPDKRVWRVELR